MAICLALLLVNLGPSVLAGFGFFVVAIPLQTYVMKELFCLRTDSMLWTGKRVKLLQEFLGGIKVIKFFAREQLFSRRIFEYRRNEMKLV